MTVVELITKLSAFPGDDIVEEEFTEDACNLVVKDHLGQREGVVIHTIIAPVDNSHFES